MQRGTGGVLQRIAYRIADDGRGVGEGAIFEAEENPRPEEAVEVEVDLRFFATLRKIYRMGYRSKAGLIKGSGTLGRFPQRSQYRVL